jgi:hypothetical protein
MKRFLSSAAIGLFAFAGIGAAQADNILLNDPVVVTTIGDVGNSVTDLGTSAGTFTLTAPETIVFDGLTSTNPNITGVAYIAGIDGTPYGGYAVNVDTGIGTGTLDRTSATLAAGTYEITYNLSNSDPAAAPSGNLVDLQAESAPEIDPASAASGLTLLAGALLVLRGRRRTTSAASFA